MLISRELPFDKKRKMVEKGVKRVKRQKTEARTAKDRG